MVTAREVIQFFKSADLELAELVLEFGTANVNDRQETRAKISANLKKARAARKPAAGASATAEAPAPVEAAPVAAAPATVAEQPARRQRHAHAEAPVTTEQAASA